MLTVVHGAFHPSLERAFVRKLEELKKGEPLAPVIVVAPSQRLSRHLAAVAAEAIPAGLAAVRFHNLLSFARSIVEERPERDARLVDDDLVLERLLVDLIVREFSDRPYLKRALRVPGTAHAILGAIKELRDGAVDPADALEAMKARELTGGEDSVKLAEIISLHYKFAQELRQRGWRDRSDVVARAAELAPESEHLRAKKAILYYGFYELVQTQLDLFRAVSGRFPVTAFYPYEDAPEYAFAREFFTNVLGGRKRAAEKRAPAGPAPRLLSASGPRDEVWAAAKEILRLRGAGIAFDEIGVIARTLDPYADLLESIFRENRIPYLSSVRIPARSDRELNLLSLADDGFPRDRVLALLEGENVAGWDLVTRLLGIGVGRGEWEGRLFPWDGREFVHSRRGRGGEEGAFRVPAATMSALVAAVRSLFARAAGPERGTWTDQAAWARKLLGPLEILASFEGLDGVVPPVDGPRFREILRERLIRAVRPAGDDNVRGVQVLDAMGARGLGFRAVILLGLNERVWPRFILEDPFIPEGTRQQIRHRLGNLLPLKLAGYDEERMLFAMATRAAREELVILWQRSDEKGRVQVPSPFIEPGRSEPVPRRPALKLAQTDLRLLTPKEAVVRAILGAPRAREAGSAAVRAFGGDAASFSASRDFLRAIEDDRALGIRDGLVGPQEEYWKALVSRGLSPTSLETFAQCPFLYFGQKLLDLDALDEPEDEREFTPRETGTFYHTFLERLYRGFGGKVPASLKDARARFDECFDRTRREFEERRTLRFPVLWEVERAHMKQVLESFVDHDLANRDGFVPSFFEEPVSGTLDLPLGRHQGVRFMGFIDRMDLHPSGAFRVIDYKKSGSVRFAVSMEKGVLEKGVYLQPPIYFLLGRELLRGRGQKAAVEASASGYFFLEAFANRDEKGHELWLRGDFWEKRERFAEVLRRYLDAIAAGEFPIHEDDHCKRCDFSTACRRKHQPTRWRARQAEEKRREG